jgi:antitoxin component YwqK of YwqJK toxin-antitoxin module
LSYKGCFKNGKFDGEGEYYNVKDNTVTYKGNFVEGKYNGFGKLYYERHTISKWYANFERNAECSESFHSNLLDGDTGQDEIDDLTKFLKMSDSDKPVTQYEGKFSDGNFMGDGKFFYPNGKLKFDGNFLGGSLHGQAKFHSTDGNLVYSGQFTNNQRTGYGTCYNKDGKKCY